jgi:hypothetical protein
MSSKRGDELSRSIIPALVTLLAAITIFNMVLLTVPHPRAPTGYQSSAATGTVMFTILGTCTGPLVSGWNLISLCANVTDAAIPSALGGIDYRYVMRWNETAQDFDIFSPNAASNPFTDFEANRSYFVYVNSATANLIPNGAFNDDMNITLTPGWSTPSWPYESATNFTRYFNGSFHRYQMKWNTTTQEFVIWSPHMADPPSSLMLVGDGQFIYSENANELRYNKTNLTG